MVKVQKVYTREFKEQVVQLAQTSGKPIVQIARELGISDTSIHQWCKDLTEHSIDAFPESDHQTEFELCVQASLYKDACTSCASTDLIFYLFPIDHF